MNHKLILTDLDGTLLNSDKKISARSTSIIKSLIGQGHYFCFVTGRSLEDCLPYYKQLGLNTLCICNNGSAIHQPFDKNFNDIFFPMGNHVFFKLWESKEIKNLIEYFVIKTRHNTFINKVPTERSIKDKLKTLFHINFDLMKNIGKEGLIYSHKNRKTNILSIILVLKPGVKHEELYFWIKTLTNNLLISQWSIDNRGFNARGQIIVELNHNFANKLNALKFAQSYYDVLWNDTYVFGDGENDIAMLKQSDNSWSMKNAHSHALTTAKNITKYDNNHDGVAVTLEELFMPK